MARRNVTQFHPQWTGAVGKVYACDFPSSRRNCGKKKRVMVHLAVSVAASVKTLRCALGRIGVNYLYAPTASSRRLNEREREREEGAHGIAASGAAGSGALMEPRYRNPSEFAYVRLGSLRLVSPDLASSRSDRQRRVIMARARARATRWRDETRTKLILGPGHFVIIIASFRQWPFPLLSAGVRRGHVINFHQQ
jgi:hypothetical protein